MPTLTAPDGTSLVYDAYEPHEPRAALLFVHGWSDHAGRWAGVGARFRDAGLATYLLDLRGHGRSGGTRAHLSRFSQLLGDLQSLRRAVRLRTEGPQILVGHGFGGLVVLRYLETQPRDPPACAIVSSPWLGLSFAAPPAWKLGLARLLGDLWPTLQMSLPLDAGHLSRDAAVTSAYAGDPLVRRLMTLGAWKEIQWAQRAVPADGHHIDCPLLFLLAGEDRIADASLARAFADGLKTSVELRWYPEMYHEVLHDPQSERVFADVLAYLAKLGIA
jgi:alpha-beta hydrolase superfamily lysophospholipase